jgi:Rieske Fe-S protein
MPPQVSDRFQVVSPGPLADRVVRPEDVTLDAPPLEAFAYEPVYGTLRNGSRLYRLLITRLDPSRMDRLAQAAHADGVLVFSAVCTHKGCTVNGWDETRLRFRCPCHLSEFAPLETGRPVDGPATRSLPMLPVGVDGEGYVAALDGFNRKPGFQR